MNYISSIYAALFHGRIKEGVSVSEKPTTGNMVLACCAIIVLGSIVALLVLLVPDFGDGANDLLKSIFGRSSGKTIGRLIGVGLFLLIFPIVNYTVGTPAKYMEAINQYKALSPEEQEQVAKKGNWYMGLCLGSFVLPVIVGLIKSFF